MFTKSSVFIVIARLAKGGDLLTLDLSLSAGKWMFSHSLAEWKKSGCNISRLSYFTDCLKWDMPTTTTRSQQPKK